MLDSLRAVWLENERLIEDAARHEVEHYGPRWKPSTAEEEAEYADEQRIARHRYDRVLAPRLRCACVAGLQGIVERELLRLVRELERQHRTPRLPLEHLRSPFAFQEALRYLDLFFDLRLEDCPQFTALVELRQERDRLVSPEGVAGRGAARRADQRVRTGGAGWRRAQGADWGPDTACLARFMREVGEFFAWVYRRLNWPIEACGAAPGQTEEPLSPGR